MTGRIFSTTAGEILQGRLAHPDNYREVQSIPTASREGWRFVEKKKRKIRAISSSRPDNYRELSGGSEHPDFQSGGS
ncbi:MAG TPA: hypothetical protein PLX87_06500 [Bacteroidales bacterium]|nr:hypothetical protein [Bacteroidales bacterium]